MAKWIKVATDIFDDEKILLIESMKNADSIIVIWLKLLSFAGKQDNNGVFTMGDRISYSEDMLASIFHRDVEVVHEAINVFKKFGMIEVVEDVITVPNWNKHQTMDAYEKKKERDRAYQQEKRASQRALVEKCRPMSDDCQTTESSDVAILDIDKDIDKDYINTNCASDDAQVDHDNPAKPSRAMVNDNFEKLWSLYPSKKGKGKISDAKKRELYEVGFDAMKKAIERYVADLKKETWRKPQNGSTFFNSGYIDYLDGNYEPVRGSGPGDGFNNFQQRQYDYGELEKKLLSRNRQESAGGG